MKVSVANLCYLIFEQFLTTKSVFSRGYTPRGHGDRRGVTERPRPRQITSIRSVRPGHFTHLNRGRRNQIRREGSRKNSASKKALCFQACCHCCCVVYWPSFVPSPPPYVSSRALYYRRRHRREENGSPTCLAATAVGDGGGGLWRDG